MVAGFEVKEELIRIDKVGLLQQHWNKVGPKRLCSYILEVIFREGLLLFVLFVIGNLLVSGEVRFVRKVDLSRVTKWRLHWGSNPESLISQTRD